MRGILGDKPKALADIQGETVIDRLLRVIQPQVSEISLISNARYFSAFQDWQRLASIKVSLFQNESTHPRDRLGALGDLQRLLSLLGTDEPALVLASDTLLTGSLAGMFEQFGTSSATQLAIRHNPDRQDQKRRGVVRLSKDNFVKEFVEKPVQPATDIAACPIYLMTAAALQGLSSYLLAGGARDAPGSYFSVLCQQQPVQGWWVSNLLFDVGNPDSYQAAQAAAEVSSDRVADSPLAHRGPADEPSV